MEYIKSPLNYTGGKYKLLPQIEPLFPKDIDTFVDLFGGGFNVGINVNCNKVIYNEITKDVTDLFKNLYEHDYDYIVDKIESTIRHYNNMELKEDFLRLREDYNKNKSWDKLFVLSCFGFNYAIRFNSKGEYNIPSGIGKCRYSVSMKDRIFYLKESLNKKEISFNSYDFRDIDLSKLNKDDFVYIDPPYLISEANYNAKWTVNEEMELLKLLDDLNERGIRFALSNVIIHKGNENDLLIKWAEKYNLHSLNMSYHYSWGGKKHTENKTNQTIEVLITNYVLTKECSVSDITNDKYKELAEKSNKFLKEKQKDYIRATINASNIILY